MVHKEKNSLVLFFNGTDYDIYAEYSKEQLGLEEGTHLYDFDREKEVLQDEGKIILLIPAHGHILLKGTSDSNIHFWKESLWKNLNE